MPASLSHFARGLSAETAFDVLAVARRSRPRARMSSNCRSATAPSQRPPAPSRPASRPSAAAQTHYCPSLGLLAFREAVAANYQQRIRHRHHRGECRRRAGRQARSSSSSARRSSIRAMRCWSSARTSRPIAPNIERRGGAGRLLRAPARKRVSARPQRRRALRQADAARQGDLPQFAAQPDRRRRHRGRPARHRRPGPRPGHRGLQRRAVQPHGLGTASIMPLLAQPGMLDQAVACYTFSKSYSMSGWRLGYAISQPAHRRIRSAR